MTDIITSNDFEYEKVSQLRYFRYLKKLELYHMASHDLARKNASTHMVISYRLIAQMCCMRIKYKSTGMNTLTSCVRD